MNIYVKFFNYQAIAKQVLYSYKPSKGPYLLLQRELEQVSQKGCEFSIPGNVQGQTGWGSEQPTHVEAVHVQGRGNLNSMISKVPSMAIS